MGRSLENSRTTSRDKKEHLLLNYVISAIENFRQEKNVFWINLERKRMIYHCDLRSGVYEQIFMRKKKRLFFLQKKQPRYKTKFGLQTILDLPIK